MGRQKDFRTNYTALVGIVAVLTVILTVQFFTGAIGSRCDGGLSCTAFDLVNMKMI